jgi:hypothetical protein
LTKGDRHYVLRLGNCSRLLNSSPRAVFRLTNRNETEYEFFSYTFGHDSSSRGTIKGVIAVQQSDTKQPCFGGIAPAMIVCKEKHFCVSRKTICHDKAGSLKTLYAI